MNKLTGEQFDRVCTEPEWSRSTTAAYLVLVDGITRREAAGMVVPPVSTQALSVRIRGIIKKFNLGEV